MAWYATWLSQLDVTEFRWVLFIQILLTLALLVAGVYFIWRTHWVINTPTSKIHSAHQGYIEIEGVAQFHDSTPLVSPLTGTPCVWYSVLVEKKNSWDDSGFRNSWERVYHHQSDNLIAVDDGSGTCLVDPDGARIYPGSARQWHGDTQIPSGIVDRLFGDYRYTEKLLLPGHDLYVLGWFKTIALDPFQAEQDTVKTLLRDWKTDPDKMRTFDLNKDGQISEDEWAHARQQATQQARLDVAAGGELDKQTHLMSAMPHGRQPFIISAIDQTSLARRFRRWGYLAWAMSLVVFFFLISAYTLRS